MNETTETGIDILNYVAERASGIVAITKPVKSSDNYVYMRARHAVQLVDGKPALVEGAPDLFNINRESLISVELKLQEDEARIKQARAAITAVQADMDAADAMV